VLGLAGLGLGLASQASRVFLPRLAIHTATGKASRVYSISLLHNAVSYLHRERLHNLHTAL